MVPLTKSKVIEIVDRRTGDRLREKVYGDSFMQLFYGTRAGIWLTSRVLARRTFSRLYGMYNDSVLSRRKIAGFVRDYGIDTAECAAELNSFSSFNAFFARHLKPGARPIATEESALASSGDGRLLVFPRIDNATLGYVKWAPVRLLELFGNDKELAQRYDGGSCAILRLCPVDYHRFHFPADGLPGPTRVVGALLHSVNPYALEKRIPVFCLNRRTLCELTTERFGRVLLMEVGALCVGSIVQTYEAGKPCRKGSEKGFFKFGGSTTIAFFEPGAVQFDSDLVRNTAEGVETLVQMGERIALAPR